MASNKLDKNKLLEQLRRNKETFKKMIPSHCCGSCDMGTLTDDARYSALEEFCNTLIVEIETGDFD